MVMNLRQAMERRFIVALVFGEVKKRYISRWDGFRFETHPDPGHAYLFNFLDAAKRVGFRVGREVGETPRIYELKKNGQLLLLA